MSHTPGPWKVINFKRREGRVYEILANGHGSIALLTEFSQLQPEANARLIAAAPELWAACQAVLSTVNYTIGSEEADRYRPLLKQVRAALTHAEGRA